MQGIGLEVPSRSLGIAHVALAASLVAVALIRPRTSVRRLALGLGAGLALLLPILWLGPIWSEDGEHRRFVWGFYLTFVLSLGIPFGVGAMTVVFMARSSPSPRTVVSLALPAVAYILGLLLSYPISFNYALLYGLIR